MVVETASETEHPNAPRSSLVHTNPTNFQTINKLNFESFLRLPNFKIDSDLLDLFSVRLK